MKKQPDGQSHITDPARPARKRVRRRMLLLLFVVALMVSGLAFYKSWVRPPEVPPAPEPPADIREPGGAPDGEETLGDEPVTAAGRKNGWYTFLICGVDDDNGGGDTLIVAALDTINNKASFVSIPRDTLINVSWSVKKINSAYNAGGINRLKQEISRLIGFAVDFYITVDYDGFISLVDALKGVEFDVPYNMNYDDPTQNLHIHVSKGLQTLDGQSAAGVVRWRQNNDGTGYASGDMGRIQTQQAFLTAMVKQVLKLSNLRRVPEFAAIFNEYVETDLTVGELIWLGRKAMSIGAENFYFGTIPGNYNASHYNERQKAWLSYATLDIGAVVDLVNERLNPYNRDIDASMLDIMTIRGDGSMSSSRGVLQDPGVAVPPTLPAKPEPEEPPDGDETDGAETVPPGADGEADISEDEWVEPEFE